VITEKDMQVRFLIKNF